MESKVNFNKPSKNSTRFVNKDSFNILQSAQGLTEFHLWHVMVVLMWVRVTFFQISCQAEPQRVVWST